MDMSLTVKMKCKRVKGKVFTLLGFGLRPQARKMQTDG